MLSTGFLLNMPSWLQLGTDINYGSIVSINNAGDRVAVSGGVSDARVYSYDGSNWVQLGADMRSGIGRANSISINGTGDVVVLGLPSSFGEQPPIYGGCRVYYYNGSSWVQRGTDIIASSWPVDSSSGFGSSVSINSTGDRLISGAPTAYNVNGFNGSNCGWAKIYFYNGSGWVQSGPIIGTYQQGNYCGASVSMNSAGDRAAVGAPGAQYGGAYNVGQVMVYAYSGGSWVQLGPTIYGLGSQDSAGGHIDMNGAGNRVSIASASGIRVYSYDGVNWIQIGNTIVDSYGFSSHSMNSAGDKITTGSPDDGRDRVTGVYSRFGHTKIYSYNGANWIQVRDDIIGEIIYGRSGSTVSMNSAGSRVAIGSVASKIFKVYDVS